jgi:outer membrane protein insertion porin family
MAGSTWRDEEKGTNRAWGQLKARPFCLLCSLLLGVGLIFAGLVQAQEKRVVAVLPFSVYTPKPINHLRLELQQMFTARMAREGFHVIDPTEVNKHPKALLPRLEPQEIVEIGKELKADVVITGSLTQVGKKISLDLKIFQPMETKPPFSIFVVEEDMDRLTDAVDKSVESLLNQIAGVEQIDSIRVAGNQRIEAEAILAVVESKKGEKLDYDKLDRDLRAIYRMGFFTDVRIQTEDGPSGKIVTFQVAEKRSIGRITFTGNKKIKSDNLSKECGIKQYSILNLSEVKQSVNRLKDYYRQKGYYNVEIKDKVEDLPRNEVALTYDITEGKKVYIRKIEFVGNTTVPAKELKKVMDTSEKGLFYFITDSGVLDRKRLDFDVQKLTIYYQNKGYIKAKVGEPKVTYQEGVGLIITIEVTEGERYHVNEVKVEGDLIKPADELVKLTKIKKEKFVDREVIRQDVLALKDVYANEGYAYADVVPVTQEDDKEHIVNITYRMTQGKKVRFERINILGNTHTRDNVIRRELEVYEGELYSADGIQQSTKNLQRLGYFQDVDMQTKQGSQDDLINLNINVKERPTGSFSMGVGYGGGIGTYGILQVAENNLFGRGLKLSAAASVGTVTQLYNIRFTDPRVFDKHLEFGVDLVKWTYIYDQYTRDSTGGSLRVGFPLGLDRYTMGRVKYLYDDTLIKDIQPGAASVIQQMEGTSITSSVTFSIERDSRDTVFTTTKGSDNLVSFEYAGGVLGGNLYFNRYQAKSEWYFPLPLSTVFVARGQWGYIESRGEGFLPGGGLPVYEKYMIGGLGTLRGYSYYTVSPLDPATRDRIGGEKMLVFNLETRFPLFKEQGISGVVFFDAGNVWTKDQDYSLSDLRKSAGVGIRWYSPVGPILIDYGWILERKPEEPMGNVDFSIGGTF